MTPEAFLSWERQQSERHVYCRGEVFAMAGGSLRHSRLACRIGGRLDAALGAGPCSAYQSDLRLGIEGDHFVYADAVVACRPFALRPGTTDVVTNPRVVVEVLSKSTEAHDRGDKQTTYLALASLQHYVLVSQRVARVEVYTREPAGGFHYQEYRAGETIRLPAIDAVIAVDDLYAGAFEVPGDEEAGAAPAP